jgi:hypothetical protein
VHRSERLVEDLENIVSAIDKLIGGPLRREIMRSVTLEDLVSMKRKKAERDIPIMVERRPVYSWEEDEDNPDIAELDDGTQTVTVRLEKAASRIPFYDMMHEIGHGIYGALSMDSFIRFVELYDRMKHKFMRRVASGWHPLTAATRICSQQFFLKEIDPKEDGFISWQGYVHQDYEVDSVGKRNYFHRNKNVPRVKGFRVMLDPEEGFAELFARFYELRRRPKPYKIVPRRQVAKRKRMHPDLYDFGKRHMRRMISTARPVNRRSRKLPVSEY